MKVLKKAALACALATGLVATINANALGPFFNYVQGLQLNPVLGQAFQTPGTGVTFGGLQFRVRAPANCIDNMQGQAQTCYVALDHLDRHHGYYLTVTPVVQQKTHRLMTEVNAYPEFETLVLTYTKPYLAGTALDVVDIKNIETL